MRLTSCSLIALFWLVAPAAADPIVTYTFAGQIEDTSIASLPSGTPVVFWIPFDYGAMDTCPLQGVGFYQFPGSTIAYGGTSYVSAFTALEVNNPGGNCSGLIPGTTVRMQGFVGTPFISVLLLWPAQVNDEIPTVLVPTAGFVLVTPAEILADGTVTRVPEPSSMAMLVMAIGALVARHRIRRWSGRSE